MRHVTREIQAKTLLAHVKGPDTWFGLKYSLNLYRGCQHRCIYCDSRSKCYGIEDFDGEVLVKANALSLLAEELSRKRSRGTIGLGSMNDPYMPVERDLRLTRGALEIIADFRFGLHVLTKSDLVLRDLDLLERIARRYATVSFTITTPHDDLARKIEPGAPSSSARFRAMAELSSAGVQTGVTLMPVLPFIEDRPEDLTAIIEQAASSGATYVVYALGMTLRDRQRRYYYAKLDALFPGLRERYQRAFGSRYYCAARHASGLEESVVAACNRLGLETRIIPEAAQSVTQPRLL